MDAGPIARRRQRRRGGLQPSRQRWALGVLALFVAGGLAAVGAGDRVAASPLHPRSLWDQAVESDEARAAAEKYQYLMNRGDALATKAMQHQPRRLTLQRRRGQSRRKLAQSAATFYERAAAVRPEAAEPHYRAAEVLHKHILEQNSLEDAKIREIAERTLAHWRAFEERAPLDPRVNDTLFERAIIHTRLASQADLERAIDNYETLIERSDLASRYARNVAIWLSNLAETYMMVGRLESAITMYRRSLDYGNDPLHGYGLAVALDRNEQGALAREVMYSYAATDRLRALDGDGIFFVPEGERHYYLALGYEVLGDLKQAVVHYQRFVASGAHPRYQGRAADNLREVRRRLNARRLRGPGAAAGSPGQRRGL